MDAPWSPTSYRSKKILQQPEYADQEAVEASMRKIHALPPLVHCKEVDGLKSQLAACCRGERFLLQGGDCAERFMDCNQASIEAKFKILLQMSLVIAWGSRVPVVRVGRVAGQFAKPRSSPFETINGEKVYSYKGDNVNGYDPKERTPDPERLVSAYFHSAATLNYIRAMISGGVADLHNPHQWNLNNVLSPDLKKEYSKVVRRITDGINFMHCIKADEASAFRTVDFYTSHEGLLLFYEEALTSLVKGQGYYNLGAHFLWIGDRTRQLDGAHIEYFKGIENPIGVKCGPSMTPEELSELVMVLNAQKEEGKLSIITRYGSKKVAELLPAHIEAVKQTGVPVVWVCDPCHGNTELTETGLKTRKFENILKELLECFRVHTECGSHLGGIHLELTGDDVTECLGGAAALTQEQLSTNYQTFCDPRLNYTQSLNMAFQITNQLNEYRKSS